MSSGKRKYCPVPWHSANLRTIGDYRMCCYANLLDGRGKLLDERGEPMNMSRNGIDEIRNHPLLKEVRKSFLQGEWNAACNRCQVEEETGHRSGRDHSLTRIEEAEEATQEEGRFEQRVFALTKPDGSIDVADFPIEEIDLRFGNKCNLSCRSCGPQDSSAWYGDYVKLGRDHFSDSGGTVHLRTKENGQIEAINDRYGWYEGIEVTDRLPKDLSRLRRIYFVGGEPLLAKEHAKMLEWLIAQGLSEKIYLEYSTNLTILPQSILDLWKKFKHIGVGVSMDGFGAYHEYLRYPGKAVTIERNLRRLDECDAPLRGWLACTLSAQNVSHLADFIIWKEKQGYKKIRNDYARPPISVHLLHKPSWMCLRSLPLEAKQLIEVRLKVGMQKIRSETDLSAEKLQSTEDLFEGIIRYMNSQDQSHDWPDHYGVNEKLDQIRHQNFGDLDPELDAILRVAAEGIANTTPT